MSSGIRDLVILKSTGSGFEGYPKCKYTTLPETADRILTTSFRGTWRSHRAANDRIMAALQACPEISRIDLAMPNKHCLLLNLAPFGLENKNELFVPTEEPFGLIEASLERDG
ncbi:MAG: hypothetical protein ABI540_07350 [Spartobacteria bacterium]